MGTAYTTMSLSTWILLAVSVVLATFVVFTKVENHAEDEPKTFVDVGMDLEKDGVVFGEEKGEKRVGGDVVAVGAS